MKKQIALVLAAALGLTAMTGCAGKPAETAAVEETKVAEETKAAEGESGAEESQKAEKPANAVTVKFGNSGAVGEPAPETCQYFCDLANEALGGRYYFEFYPAEQLGNETTMLENVQIGLQDGVMTSLDTLASYAPDLNILSMAFAFDSAEATFAYLDSELGQTIFDKLEAQGIHVVNYRYLKNPRIFFGKKEIKTPADMKGMKYRIPNLPIFEKNAKAMGATPVVVAWSEYPFALMQGVVDGGECSKDSYRSLGLYEAAKFVADVDYAYPVEQLAFSTQFWNSLTPEDQKIIEDCAQKAADRHSERSAALWEEDKKWLEEEGGVTFCDIDRQAFIDAAVPLGKELQEEGFFDTPDLYDQTRQFNGK